MHKIRYAITMLLALLFLTAQAQQPSFTMIPPRGAVEGRNFTITYRLTNGDASSAPKEPEIPNCKFLASGTSTMHSIQVVNGRQESMVQIDFNFTYRATAAGEVTVPAVSIRANGKTITAPSAKLTILPADSNAGPAGPSPGVQQPQSADDFQVEPDDMFVRVILSRSSVCEQEPVIATVKLYTRYNITSFRVISQPTYEGFFSEDIDVQSEPEYEHVDGKNYITLVLRKSILYPQKTGRLEINSGKYEVTLQTQRRRRIGMFYESVPVEKDINTQSNSAVVNVEPLPTPKPEGFNGAVGHFTATAELTESELRTNEATSYILKIEGTGNVKFLQAPKLDLPSGIDAYTPKTDIKAKFTGSNMTGTYTVNYTLVPQDPGQFEIPARKFSYFDPSDKQYHTIDLPSFSIKVAQGAGVSGSVVEQSSIAKGMTDILHIKPVAANSLSKSHKYVFESGLYWLLYVLCALALVASIFLYSRNIKLNADVQGRKLAGANKQAAKRLKAAKAAMGKEPDKYYAELNQAMSGYLSDKLGIPASQLVRDNIQAKLSEKGVGQEAIGEAISVLDECEMARFTPQHSDAEMAALYKRAADAIKNIESSIKKG